MEFLSQKTAYDFYNTYGYITGFSIRMQTFYKNAKGVVTSIRLVFSKQGFNKKQKQQLEYKHNIKIVGVSIEKTPEKITSMEMCGCKASCQVRLHKDHNHPLIKSTTSKKRDLRSHNKISMEDKAYIELLTDQNVGAAQTREHLAAKALTKRMDRIVNKGSKSRAAYEMACTILDELDERLTKINEEIAEEKPSTKQNPRAEENIKDYLTFHDPLVSQCKGKRKSERLKPLAEVKAAKKT